MEEKDEDILKVPDKKTIPCLNCKKGKFNYLAMYCLAYDKKPDEIYFDNVECPNREPIIKEV